jgi:pre-mRNA-splicing factor ATP-dependent RNA helicase DHX38/PRP16
MREFIADPSLSSFAIVLMDETHERTIDRDIILGLLKQLCAGRRHVLTLKSNKFIDFLGKPPF